MRKIFSTIAASAMVLTGLVATTTLTAAPAQAANHAKCVTAKEHAAIKPGKSKASIVKLLDGKGTKVSSKTRRYKRCGSGQKVYVTYNKSFSKKSARVAKVRPVQVIAKPKPPVKPTPPPVKPPVQAVPSYPNIQFFAPLETSVSMDWTKPDKAANPAITHYRFGWVSKTDGTEWTSPDVAVSAAKSPYVFKDLKPGTSYGFWIQAKNAKGYGEQQWATAKTLAVTEPGDRPLPATEERSVVDEARCQILEVDVLNQTRTNTWQWDGVEWIDKWSEWTTTDTSTRPATAEDCVNVVDTLSSDVLLPDIRPVNLDQCSDAYKDSSTGSCFTVLNPVPLIHDFPNLEGKKLLKFPALTMNAGAGPTEVIADRSSRDQKDWVAYQTFYRPNGERESIKSPAVKFYYAGDGHNHWHFTDFDTYWIESLDGTELGTAEKHGYCLEDNTKIEGFTGSRPASPVYANATSCGKGLPDALTIIEGLSQGWGDTYPPTLPDQGIDITGLPDGRYRVGITVDNIGAVKESNESNNTATIEITISGDTVTTVPGTAKGGLN